MSNHLKCIRMAYVLDDREEQKVVDATDPQIERIDMTDSDPSGDTKERTLDFSLLSFYVDDLPDITKSNEAFLKMTMNSRLPESADTKDTWSTIMEFSVDDKSYASGFYARTMFKNMLFRNDIHFGIELKEKDPVFQKGYKMIKTIVNDIGGLDSIDILQGIPYSELITKLANSIFSQIAEVNMDDNIWNSIPTMSLKPFPGGVVLRTGIYILYQTTCSNKKDPDITYEDFYYKEGAIYMKNGKQRPNCLVMSIRLNKYVPEGSNNQDTEDDTTQASEQEKKRKKADENQAVDNTTTSIPKSVNENEGNKDSDGISKDTEEKELSQQ